MAILISKLKGMFTELKAKAKKREIGNKDQPPEAAQTPSGGQALAEYAGELVQRVNRAAESILENESLTADLDDEAAKALLDWGITCAEMIARSTAGLNDSEAEEAMSLRLRAIRRLMRLVNRWGASYSEMDAEAGASLLTRIIEQAAIIYGEEFTPPNDDRRDAFLKQHLADPPLPMIVNLRKLVENSGDNSTTSWGGNDG